MSNFYQLFDMIVKVLSYSVFGVSVLNSLQWAMWIMCTWVVYKYALESFRSS